MRRAIVLTLVLSMAAASCSAEPTEDTTTTTLDVTTTTTTVPPTTTTTEPPIGAQLAGAPPQLVDLVVGYYAYAGGSSADPPPAPAELLPQPGQTPPPLEGEAAVALLHGQQIAVVTIGNDLLAAIDDGTGWRLVGGNAPTVGAGPYWGAFPRIVAVVGSDARPGENVERTRADSLHLVGLDGQGGAGVVGIPRDSYVPVPDRGRRKINAALAIGGPELLTATLESTSGIELEGYLLTGFVGFQEMLGHVLGGINLDIPLRIVDSASGANFSPGEQYLNGPNALAFARARKSLPRGDFTRQLHGGLLILGSLFFAQVKGPLAVPGLLEGSEPWMFTNLTPEQLLTFSLAALETRPWEIPNVVVPGRSSTVGGASVVLLSPEAGDVFSDLADGRLDGDY
jgi:polyisoprenyl-teichoic acid--peptidoglycan teichoic acid transferase